MRYLRPVWAAFATSLVLLGVPGSSLAQPNPAATGADASGADTTVVVPAGQASQQRPPSGDEMICQISAPMTGTRLGGGRECHTRRDWDRRQHDAQLLVQKKQSLGFVWSPTGGGH